MSLLFISLFSLFTSLLSFVTSLLSFVTSLLSFVTSLFSIAFEIGFAKRVQRACQQRSDGSRVQVQCGRQLLIAEIVVAKEQQFRLPGWHSAQDGPDAPLFFLRRIDFVRRAGAAGHDERDHALIAVP